MNISNKYYLFKDDILNYISRRYDVNLFYVLWNSYREKKPPNVQSMYNYVLETYIPKYKYNHKKVIVYYDWVNYLPLISCYDADSFVYKGDASLKEIEQEYGKHAKVYVVDIVQYWIYQRLHLTEKQTCFYMMHHFLQLKNDLFKMYEGEEIVLSDTFETYFKWESSYVSEIVADLMKNMFLFARLSVLAITSKTQYEELKVDVLTQSMFYHALRMEMRGACLTTEEWIQIETLLLKKWRFCYSVEEQRFNYIERTQHLLMWDLVEKLQTSNIGKVYADFVSALDEKNKQLQKMYELKRLMEMYFRATSIFFEVSIYDEIIVVRLKYEIEKEWFYHNQRCCSALYLDTLKRLFRIVEMLALQRKCVKGVVSYLIMKSTYNDNEYIYDREFTNCLGRWILHACHESDFEDVLAFDVALLAKEMAV